MRRPVWYSLLLVLTVVFTLLAILTALPLPAHKANVLGYVSHCSFVPWSTLILLGLAGICCILRSAFKGKRVTELH
jgi:hypothetical protein